VAVLVVIGGEKPVAERACVGEAAESVREVRHIFEGLELDLGIGAVVRCPGPGVRTEKPEGNG
jgi:hypothetical protein